MSGPKIDKAERTRRNALSDEEARKEAEASCVPCKLCGGKAVITDAGPGYGYNINCENWMQRKNECFQGGTRISGWAYNVADRWNELNAIAALPAQGVRVKQIVEGYAETIFDAPIYTYHSEVTGKEEAIDFSKFGLSVDIHDAKALGVHTTYADRWHGISDIRRDEVRDTEIEVMRKALAPLADTLLAALEPAEADPVPAHRRSPLEHERDDAPVDAPVKAAGALEKTRAILIKHGYPESSILIDHIDTALAAIREAK